MAEYFYILYTIFYIILLVYGVFVYRQTRRLTSILIMLNAIGLLWENGVIASGRFIGEGSLLQVLNMGRYCLHYALVPPLAWALLEQVRLAGHAWAGTKLARGLTIAAVLGMMVFGFGASAPGLFPRLTPETLDGVLRYTAPNLASTPIAIFVMSVALAAGLVLWMKNKWPWLFLAALLAFAVDGGLRNFELLNLVAGNGAEVLFQVALLQTELFVTRKP
jgi:hypothetical protein